jgi:thiamine-monophosphate kinase
MESELLHWLRSRLPADRRAPLGLTDDAALLMLPTGGQFVATTDLLTEGVDFLLAEADPQRIGRKALAVNLSDLAAMAARPVAALVSLALPRSGGLALAKSLYEGMLPLAAEFDIAIAGGDTNAWDGGLVLSVTAMGTVGAKGPLRRSSARPGDWLLVTGEFGGSLLGRHFDFTPRVAEALLLHERYDVRAGLDCSDGLARDAAHLAEESGCGLALRLADVPVSASAAERAATSGRSPLDHALGDGEDFELILAVAPDDARRLLADQPLETPLTCMGEFVAQPGLWQWQGDKLLPLAPTGWEHRFA